MFATDHRIIQTAFIGSVIRGHYITICWYWYTYLLNPDLTVTSFTCWFLKDHFNSRDKPFFFIHKIAIWSCNYCQLTNVFTDYKSIGWCSTYILSSQTQFFLGGQICTQVQNETDSYHRGSGSYRAMAKSMRTRKFRNVEFRPMWVQLVLDN